MNGADETLPAAILRALSSEECHASYSFWGKSEVVLTGAEMARRISGVAGCLRQQGMAKGRVLPILCPTSPELWTTFAGAMAAGCVPTNLPLPTFKTHLPSYLRNLEALMTRYETDVIAGSAEVRARLQGSVPRSVRWIDCSDLQTEANVGAVADASTEIAFLQHSSGSTGVPKGVAISHRSAISHLRAYAEAIDLDPNRDVIASWLPLYHDMGLITSFLLPLASSTSCRSTTPEGFIMNPLGFVGDMGKSGATLSWWPNFAFALLADRRRALAADDAVSFPLSGIRRLINCSEVVVASSMDRFTDAFAADGLQEGALQASYAMAENVFAVTQTSGHAPTRLRAKTADLQPGKRPRSDDEGDKAFRTLVSSGRPIDSVKLQVVDAQRREVDAGVVGEIAIGGPFVFSEYLKLLPETMAAKEADWYYTRDLGFLWEGELYVLGRDSDVIVVGGRKFLPNEVERIGGETEGVKAGRIVAFGVRSEAKGTEEAVVVVESPDAGNPARERAIRRAVTQAVLQQMDLALNDVRVLPEGRLIKTSSGKIARNDNRNAYLMSLSADASGEEPNP